MAPRRVLRQKDPEGAGQDGDQREPPPPPPPLPPAPPLIAFERASVDMLAGITRLLEHQADRPRKTREEDIAERFRRQDPKEFAGTTDPLVSEEWIRSLEMIFAYMGIQDADRVRCAIYMLKNDATLWWEGAVIGLDAAGMTWRDFRTVFFEKYFTEDVRGRLVRDFLTLRQGDRSLAKYVKQFERGCHFVPMIAEDEGERLRHFTDGLRPDIKHDVFMADVATYKAAVNKAYRSEIGRREMQAEYQRKRQFQQPSRGQSS
ncbi:uncharacterized protein [Henckelia pumila]|uniref:uncharacterized protein n=1 Tax=Henckelia pumila TaxID=405737 RepID=UPI003C6E9E39